MKSNKHLKPINTIELNFKTKEDFLKWREDRLQEYEKSKIDYENEINNLMGNQHDKLEQEEN